MSASSGTEVKERPILFSGPMVRAILEGRKTMTRRVVKFDPAENWCDLKEPSLWVDKIARERTAFALSRGDRHKPDQRSLWMLCPYGEVGEKLWVRETWQCTEEELPLLPLDPALWTYWQKRVRYAADGDYDVVNPKPWKPSIHMPRWASRITLEITGVRVERLQDISEVASIAEGVTRADSGLYRYDNLYEYLNAKFAFRALWDSINGERPGCAWKDNPWTWVLEFEKVVG